jgi:hypothetical protein
VITPGEQISTNFHQIAPFSSAAGSVCDVHVARSWVGTSTLRNHNMINPVCLLSGTPSLDRTTRTIYRNRKKDFSAKISPQKCPINTSLINSLEPLSGGRVHCPTNHDMATDMTRANYVRRCRRRVTTRRTRPGLPHATSSAKAQKRQTPTLSTCNTVSCTSETSPPPCRWSAMRERRRRAEQHRSCRGGIRNPICHSNFISHRFSPNF